MIRARSAGGGSTRSTASGSICAAGRSQVSSVRHSSQPARCCSSAAASPGSSAPSR